MHDSTTPALLTLPPKQPYRINNCKFQNSMISFLSELHTTKAYTDVVLHAEGKTLYAHKVVLAAGSSYFNNLFKSLTPLPDHQSPHCPSSTLVVAMPNVKWTDLEKVVTFIYLGFIDIVNSELEGFVDLAKQLGVVGMSDDEEPETKQDAESSTTQQEEEETVETYEEETFENQTELQDSPENSPPDVPPPLPNEFLQLNYNDECEEEMDEDDEEDDDNTHGGSSSAGNSYYGNSGQEKPWKCTKCGKSYNSNKSLWRHKKFTCDEKIEFRCTVCGKSFSRSDNLRRHVVVAHS